MAVALATAALADAGRDAAFTPVVRFTRKPAADSRRALDALRVRSRQRRASIAVESTGRRVVYQAGSAEVGSATERAGPARHAGAACNAGRRRRDADARAARPASTSRRSSTRMALVAASC
jgi:hypothetical protein